MAKNRGMHGITKETHKNILIDAGVVILNYGLGVELGERVLGATAGGNTFTVEREIRDMAEGIDGSKGKTKGMRRVVAENAMLGTNLIELTLANMTLAMAGAIAAVQPADPTDLYQPEGYTEIISSDIQDDTYIDNIALAGTLSSGDPIIVIIYNALSDENFELGQTDKEESILAVTFSAHWDYEDENRPPWAIRYPKRTEV